MDPGIWALDTIMGLSDPPLVFATPPCLLALHVTLRTYTEHRTKQPR